MFEDIIDCKESLVWVLHVKPNFIFCGKSVYYFFSESFRSIYDGLSMNKQISLRYGNSIGQKVYGCNLIDKNYMIKLLIGLMLWKICQDPQFSAEIWFLTVWYGFGRWIFTLFVISRIFTDTITLEFLVEMLYQYVIYVYEYLKDQFLW